MTDDFRLRPSPLHASDETINRMWDGTVAITTNPETLLGDQPVGYVIDLRRKYAFEYRMVGTYRKVLWECIDMLTHDPDPDSTWYLIGYGATQGDAQADLLEKIAYAVAHE